MRRRTQWEVDLIYWWAAEVESDALYEVIGPKMMII